MTISATTPFSANGSLVDGQPITHVTAAQMEAGVDAASGSGSGAAVYSPWQMMTPNDLQVFTAATGLTMDPDGQMVDQTGNPVPNNTTATTNAANFAMALAGSSLSSGQSVTAAGLQQIATTQAAAGFALDPTMLSKGLAFLEQQESGGTGQTLNAYV